MSVELLEPRLLLDADVVISELVASNSLELLDYYDDDSDWIELHNRGPSRVDLEGWHLSDNLQNLTQWQFPVSTLLAPGERLVVFASGEDSVTANGELHTNFRINADGEPLILANPEGAFIHGFDSAIPSQARNVSYGLVENVQVTQLVTSRAPATALIPTDGNLAGTWTGSDEPFDETHWVSGTTGVGYDTSQIGGELVPPIAYWTFDELIHGGTSTPDETGRYDGIVSGATLTAEGQGRFGKALSFDGDNDSVSPGWVSELAAPAAFSISLWFQRSVDHADSATNHSVNNVLIAQSSSGSNDNLEIGTQADAIEVYLDTVESGGTVAPVRQPAAVLNDTWHHLVVSYDSEWANELKLYVDGSLVSEQSEFGGLVSDSGSSPFSIGLARPGENEWGDFQGLIDDVAIWDVSLDADHVLALLGGTSPLSLSGYSSLIGLDLAAELGGGANSTSAYVRIPFTVDNPTSFDLLTLRMQYNDAFVGYVNGTEVARANVTGVAQWNMTADSDRPDKTALKTEEFFVPNTPGLLNKGSNQLALHALNFDNHATRLLVLPELEGVHIPHKSSLIDYPNAATVLIPANDALATTWTTEVFNDSTWTSGTTGVGFDTSHTRVDAASPVAHWTFDTLVDDGTRAPDAKGNYDGVVSGATLTSGNQGRFGEALLFDGDNDSVSPGVVAELVSPSEFSISLWFQRTLDHGGDPDATNHSVNNVLIAQSSNAANDNLEIGTEADLVEVYLDTEEFGATAPPVRQPSSIQNDRWHHLVVTYASRDLLELKLYVDGTLVNAFEDWGGLVSSSGNSPLAIGLARPGQNEWGDFEGLIDDVAIWDVALDVDHVSTLFGGTSPSLFLPVVSPPIAYWAFDELVEDGTLTPDGRGRYDGAVSGATLTSGGQGRLGEALSFDGDNDSVSAGVVQEWVSPSEFTTSLWFQRTADHADPDGATNHTIHNVLIAQSSDGSNDNLEIGTAADTIEMYLDTAELGGATSTVSQSASIENDTWHHLVVSYDSDNAKELKLYVDGIRVSEHSDYGGQVSSGGTSPFTIGLSRPGQDAWGDFEGLVDDVAIWDEALEAEHVAALFQGKSPLSLSGYTDLIGLDLESARASTGPSTSAYVRIPFTPTQPDSLAYLTLRMQYDDAFVAYINGTEVARANVTGSPRWDSVADSERSKENALLPVEFIIANTPGLLNAGENVLAIHALNGTAGATQLLILPELEGTPLPNNLFSFMDTPTPGEANSAGLAHLMNPPTFSAANGTFTESFLLELTTDPLSGDVRYTMDRGVPDESSTLYTEPIRITKTTQIRARAFGNDSAASDVVSETYILLDDDLQEFSSDIPIMVLDNFGRGIPGRGYQDAFLAVFEPDETGRSRLTNPIDTGSRIGLHIQGNSSASFPKPGYRVELRDEANQDRAMQLIGLPAESDFVLKGPFEQDRTLIKNALAFDLSRQIGHYGTRTRFVELYTRFTGTGAVSDSHYRGVYVLTERIKADKNRVDIERLSRKQNTEPEVTGGYMFKIDPVGSGYSFSSSRGKEFVLFEPDSPTTQQRTYIHNYVNDLEAALYGPNFTDPDIGYRAYLDVESFIDEHMMRSLASSDFSNSTYLFKDRGGKVSFGPLWDFNSSFTGSTSGIQMGHGWYIRLFEDPDFAQQWIDYWQELRQSVFTVENLVATVDGMASELAEAQVRNVERWPETAPFLDYEAEISRLKDWLANRLKGMDNLMLPPVTFNKHGLTVPVGFEVTLSAVGTIYYTLDGSDPRAPGGEISLQAIEYTGGPIVTNDTTRIVTRTRGEQGGIFKTWSAPASGDFGISNGLVVSEVQYNPHAALPGQGEVDTDNDDFEYIELSNTGIAPIDLGGMQFVQVDVDREPQGINFTFDTQILDPGEQIVVVKNRAAFESRYGTSVRIADGDDGLGGNDGEFGDQLSNRGELIKLALPSGISLFSLDYKDRDAWPQRADGDGSSLELIDPLGDSNDPANWRSSVEFGGSPGSEGIGNAGSVVVNEVLTNTPGPVDDAIEFYNPTAVPINMGGMWLSDRLNNLDRFVIPANTFVPAAGYLVLDENDFDFGLSGNEGEDVVLVQPDASGNPDLFIDHVTFGPAVVGESFGRWPDSMGVLYPMISTTLGSANSGPRIGRVVITEVMYNPPESEFILDSQLLEFIEIYNSTTSTVDLTDWIVDGIGYQFPDGATIDPGQTLTLVPFNPAGTMSDAFESFQKTYDVDIVGNLSSFLGPCPGRVNDDGGTLTLRRPLNPGANGATSVARVIEDQLSYDDLAPWPTAADGAGVSLQRLRVDLWATDPATWTSGTPTPTRLGVKKTVQLAASTMVIGEFGKVTNLTHVPQTINLTRSYTNPVVFAQPASFFGEEPVVVRVSDVQPNRFNLFLVEPSNLNGMHNAEETVSYVVLEAGNHWLPNGTHLEVGTVATGATVGALVPVRTWETVDFSSSFTANPVVLSQVQTAAGEPFLSTRQRLATTGNFQVALEAEEQFASQHAVETVGYLAIDTSSGTWNGMPFDAETSRDIHSEFFRSQSFGQGYIAKVPSILASLATYKSIDNSHLRFRDLGLDHFSLKVEEDTTADAEFTHPAGESISYLAIGGQDPLTAVTTSIPDSLTRSFNLDFSEIGRVGDLDVNLELVHTVIEDLDIFLEAPDGTMVELLTDLVADGDRLTETTLDDEADQSITAGTAPYTGRFQPEGLLRGFGGKDITGTWTLHVTDDTAGGDRGALLRWSLDILLAPEPPGNLNFDANVDATDIDLLFANLGSADPAFDLDGDGDVDAEDVDRLVLNVMGRRFGDTDLDKDVDINDFNRFTLNYDPLGQHPFNGWARGNIDGDADVDLTDAMRVVLNFAADGYSLVAKDAAFTFENNLTRATWPGVIPLASPEQNSSPEYSIVLEEDTEPLTNRLGVQPNDQSIVSDDSMVTSRKRSKPVNVLRQDEIDWSIWVSR